MQVVTVGGTRSRCSFPVDVAHAHLLGAVCTALVSTLKRFPDVKLERAPRMVDFAKVGAAAEEAIGLGAGEFLRIYERNRKDANSVPLETPFAEAIPIWNLKGPPA